MSGTTYVPSCGTLGGMEETGSLVRRWRLGKQLRVLRESVGKSQDEAADHLGVKRPSISRIENGRYAILPKHVRSLCALYQVEEAQSQLLIRLAEESNERGWWTSYGEGVPDWFETYVGFEADAREIRTYQSELVPGLLQTPGYVRAIMAAYRSDGDEIEKAVAFRLERQKRMEIRQPSLRFVLNEAVLRRPVDDMREQIEHLIEMSRREFITLQVLPFEAGPHRGMRSSFALLTLPDESDPNFVYLEHDEGAVYLERPGDLRRYVHRFDALVDLALLPSDTEEFLVSL